MRRLFRDVCTVYNRAADPRTRREHWTRTVVRGVHWQGGGAVADRKLPEAGAVWLFIPFSARAEGTYVEPRAFAREPEGKWTLREGDLICPGEGPLDPEEADTFAIVSAGENGFGSRALRHWEVCAR